MNFLFRCHRSQKGIALVLTLSILALVVILLVSFVVSMRVEHTAAKNFNDLVKARQLAQGAVDQAVATIRSATPVPTTASTWVAMPGAIVIASSSAASVTSNLFTDPGVLGAGSINLNTGGLITGSNSFYGASAIITAGWQKVTLASGELVGRFAYWTDVEATKVNVNEARARNPFDDNMSNLTNIDLRALEDPLFNALTNTVIDAFWNAHATPASGSVTFNTAEEMRRGLPGSVGQTWGGYDSNKFFVTVGTYDTNTDAFGRDRIDLTAITSDTSPAWNDALARFQDNAWGRVLYPSIVNATRDTLQEKYGAFGAKQILANIVDYQKPETAIPTGNNQLDVNGIPLYYSGLKKVPLMNQVIVHVATNAVDAGGGVSNLVVHVFVDVCFVNPYRDVNRGDTYSLKVEPLSANVTYTNPGPATVAIPVSEITKTLASNVTTGKTALVGSYSGVNSLGCAPPPEYTLTINGTAGLGPPVAILVNVQLKRIRFLRDAANDQTIVDWMAPVDFDADWPPPLGMTFPNAGSLSEIVPYVNTGTITSPKFNQDVYNNSASFTFGTNMTHRPLGMLKQDPRVRTFTGIAAGDMAMTGPLVTTNWFAAAANENRTPATAGGDFSYTSRITPENYGMLGDVREQLYPIGGITHRGCSSTVITEAPFVALGELSFIHTGYPWRGLRLRSVIPETQTYSAPTDQAAKPYRDHMLVLATSRGLGDPNIGRETVEADALPDWILFDIFKVGPSATFSGRVNINTKFSGIASGLPSRTVPIESLLNATSFSNQVAFYFDPSPPTKSVGTNVEVVAGYIANRDLVSNTVTSPYAASLAYMTPGEICEAQLLGFFKDGPETIPGASILYGNNPTKYRREQMIRRISNIVTARSSTFTIWGMAQTIKEVPGFVNGSYDVGKDLVTGEVKVQAIIDRYEEGGVVKFRTRYYRFIYD